jgi:hypothetical protein
LRWDKRFEFMKYIDLPRFAAMPLEIALGSAQRQDLDLLAGAGWLTVRAENLNDPQRYFDYIVSSKGEFTVVKDQYFRLNTGWFSDRSVCYLAAGRPVITQDTAFSKVIPTGDGLLTYGNVDEAVKAIGAIAADYSRHSRAALQIATEYFDGRKVVGAMLGEAGLL